MHDRQTGITQRVNVDSSGNQASAGGGAPSVSSDGGFVAFKSRARDLIDFPADPRMPPNVFMHERDTTAPRVTRAMPTEGASGVALKADLTATFSERMEKTTLTKATFRLYELLKNPDGTTTTEQVTNVTVTPSPDGLKARLNPFGGSDGQLAKNTRYKAVVSKRAMDVFGNPLDQNPSVSGNQPKAWHFKTRN